MASSTKSDFDKWKGFVINYSGLGAKESLVGLTRRQTLVPLRSDIQHLRFSPDGQYVLAQDASTVSVVKREPFSVVFRVEVEDAFPAIFSPDSQSLVVYNRNLRVQKWNISDQKLISTNEIALPGGGYWQTRISPVGNYVACYKFNADLIVYDVVSGEEVFKQKDFYLPSYWEVFWWDLMKDYYDGGEYPALNIEFSPDGKYFIAGKRTFGRDLFGNFMREQTVAVDLSTRQKISIGENVKKLLLTSMDFIGSNKVIGQYGSDAKKSGVFTFPDGERLAQFELSGSNFWLVTQVI